MNLARKKLFSATVVGDKRESFSISGTVYDADGSTAVEGATLSIGDISVESASDGSYIITGILEGTTGEVSCTKDGYFWTNLSINTISSNLIEQNFTNAELSAALIQEYGASEVYPLVDISSGNTITAKVNEARNGTLVGWDLQGSVGPTPETLAPYSDGTSDYANTDAIGSIFNGGIGSILIFGKVSDSSVWGDDNNRTLFLYQVNNSNKVHIYKHAYLGLYANVAIGGVLKVIPLGYPDTDWFMASVSWRDSANGDEVKVFLNGTQIGATRTGFGTWTGTVNYGRVGALSAIPAESWKGWLAYHALKFGSIWTPTEMQNIYANTSVSGDVYTPSSFVAFGDSITLGGNASNVAYSWPSLVAPAIQKSLIRSGYGGTVLQNTVQNSVANIGGAAVNNGRDTYISRIINNDPDCVLILYGTNDIRLNDPAFSADLYENNLSEIVDGLIAAGITAQNIVIGSPPYMEVYDSYASPWDGGNTTKHETYVAKCEAVATTKGTKYANVYQAMIDNGGAALLDSDDVHPNDAGHEVIANAFLEVL